jgi:CheY-like chemotaxis protein
MNIPENTLSDSDTEPSSGATSVASHHRILVAEDNEINRVLATDILEFLGFIVLAVENGKEALKAALQESFDLILMDCQMPFLNGYEATRQIRAKEEESGQAKTPIVALSGHDIAERWEECCAAGMDDYLQKPFTIVELQKITSRWVAAQKT